MTRPVAPATPHPDIIRDILPAKEVSIIAGSSGCGKSTLLMQMLASYQNGEDAWLGHEFHRPTSWGYIANDHSWKLYEGTAARAGLDINALPHISVMDDESIDLEAFKQSPLHVLEALLARLREQGADAIIVDTLVSWFGGDIRNYNIPAYALLRLGRQCRKLDITILGTHHTTKARDDYTFKRPQDRISGSGALLGFSSTQLTLIPPEENGKVCHEFHIIAHNAPAKMLSLRRGSAESGGLFEVFQPGAGQEELRGVDLQIFNLITGYDGASVTRAMIAQVVGESATLDRHLKGLTDRGFLRKVRRGEYVSNV